MKALDRVLGWLMVLGGIGHGLGSYQAYRDQPMALLCSGADPAFVFRRLFAGFFLLSTPLRFEPNFGSSLFDS